MEGEGCMYAFRKEEMVASKMRAGSRRGGSKAFELIKPTTPRSADAPPLPSRTPTSER